MEEVKYGVQFEEDEDPVEFFKTKEEAEKRIEQLLEKNSVKKDKIYMFEVGKRWKVYRPISYKLMELVAGRKTKKVEL